MPTTINPYLIFNGTAEQAVRLYERALGAKTEALSRFGDVPNEHITESEKNRVMHAQLRIGEGVLMISDTMPDSAHTIGANVEVCLQYDKDQLAEMAAQFDALAQGGEVRMPLQDTFWGARFGMLTDSVGVRWMFNCQTAGE
jgi:PhnB protein